MNRTKLTFLVVLLLVVVGAFAGQTAAQIVTTFPFNDDFESQSPLGTMACGQSVTLASPWTNATDDGIDWYTGAGGTSSSFTGPSVDQNPGTASGVYLYTEGSGCFNNTARLLSPQFDVSAFVRPPVVSYYHHMYGGDQGQLHTDVVEQLNSGNGGTMLLGALIHPGSNFVSSHVGTTIEVTSPSAQAGIYTITGVDGSTGVNLSPAPTGFTNNATFVHTVLHSNVLAPVTDNQDLWQKNSGFVQGLLGGGSEQLLTVVVRGVTGPGIQSDMAIDDFTFDELPLISSFPYVVDFEDDDGFFVSGGDNKSWEHGVPSGGFIPAAANGSNAWVTNLTGNYNNDEDSFLQTPVLDFTAMSCDPILEFSHIFEIEVGTDQTSVEISINGGAFASLGSSGTGPGSQNWYNVPGSTLWNGTSGSSGTWRTARHTIDGGAGNEVAIRWVFSSNTNGAFSGVGVDDVKIMAGSDGQEPRPGVAVFDANAAVGLNGMPVSSGCPGPYFATAPAGGSLDMHFEGAADQPFLLLGGALTNAGQNFGAPYGKLDIGDPGPTNIILLGNGTNGSFVSNFFTLNSSGTQDLSFSVPAALANTVLGFQAIMLNPGILVGLSNSVEVTFTP